MKPFRCPWIGWKHPDKLDFYIIKSQTNILVSQAKPKKITATNRFSYLRPLSGTLSFQPKKKEGNPWHSRPVPLPEDFYISIPKKKWCLENLIFQGNKPRSSTPSNLKMMRNLEDDATLFQTGPITRYPQVPAVKKYSLGGSKLHPKRGGRLRSPKRFGFGHSVCFEVPKPMCSTSKLQVWKSHLKQTNKETNKHPAGRTLKGFPNIHSVTACKNSRYIYNITNIHIYIVYISIIYIYICRNGLSQT